jgi:hypothetical protein
VLFYIRQVTAVCAAPRLLVHAELSPEQLLEAVLAEQRNNVSGATTQHVPQRHAAYAPDNPSAAISTHMSTFEQLPDPPACAPTCTFCQQPSHHLSWASHTGKPQSRANTEACLPVLYLTCSKAPLASM